MDLIKVLEKQSGFLRLLIHLYVNGEKQITEILDDTNIPVHQLYASIEKGKDLGFVSATVNSSKYPPRSIISLTGKGKKVAEKLADILKIMESE
ncbi:MAG: hypothetical protein ACYCT2_04645 [Thermoplasmataceae archaeon]